jgi:hypothetical protein
VSAASGAQWLSLAALLLAIAVFSGLLATGMFIASAKLGLLSVRARYVTMVGELLLFAPGVALAAVGTYATQHAGTPANPATDEPFADGSAALIALTGMTFAGGAVVVLVLLLLSPTARKGFRK